MKALAENSALTTQGGHAMLHRLVPLVLEIIVLFGAVAVAAPPVKHPNLLLNRDEIEQEVSLQFATKAEVGVLRQNQKEKDRKR
jgi:hypothetical protein